MFRAGTRDAEVGVEGVMGGAAISLMRGRKLLRSALSPSGGSTPGAAKKSSHNASAERFAPRAVWTERLHSWPLRGRDDLLAPDGFVAIGLEQICPGPMIAPSALECRRTQACVNRVSKGGRMDWVVVFPADRRRVRSGDRRLSLEEGYDDRGHEVLTRRRRLRDGACIPGKCCEKRLARAALPLTPWR